MENTNTNKTTIKQYLWHYAKIFLKKLIKFVALNLYRVLLIVTGYAFHMISVVAEFGLRIVNFVARDVGMNFNNLLKEPEGESNYNSDFDQKFTKTDIEQIAGSINPDAKIKEIEEHLGVSYRQARKIQQAAKNPLSVNHYQIMDKTA